MFTPSNIFGHEEPRIVARLDYFGQPYEYKTIIKKLPNKAELWKKWRAAQTWEAGGGFDAGRVERHFEIELQKINENGNNR